MLITIFLLPLLGAITISTMAEDTNEDLSRIKKTALSFTLATFIISMVLWSEFDSSLGITDEGNNTYQFVTELTNTSFFSLRFGIDGISLYFVLLTTFTMPFSILASWDNVPVRAKNNNMKSYLIAFLVFEALTIAVFIVLDVMAFYVAFEAVLIPLFLIIGIWGAGPARVRASYLFFLYTLFGSLFMLLAFVALYYMVGSTDFEVLTSADLSLDTQKILWLAIFLSFAVKTPLVPLHLWLVRAHVEASVAGSMVLAGLVLKSATYGIIRTLLAILPEASIYFAPLAMTLGVISIVYGSLSAIRQTDFKCLVAYSSIAHMGVCVVGLFSNTLVGIEGALLLSIAHGFVSPAMFFIVGGVIYDRFHTRVIRYYRGLTVYMPVAMTMFFLFTCANMGVPLSVNWVGEFMALAGTFSTNPLVGGLASISIVLGACYSIWLYNRLAFGSYSPYLAWTTDLTRREFMVLFTMLIPTIVFGLYPNIILNDLHSSVSILLTSISLL